MMEMIARNWYLKRSVRINYSEEKLERELPGKYPGTGSTHLQTTSFGKPSLIPQKEGVLVRKS